MKSFFDQYYYLTSFWIDVCVDWSYVCVCVHSDAIAYHYYNVYADGGIEEEEQERQNQKQIEEEGDGGADSDSDYDAGAPKRKKRRRM